MKARKLLTCLLVLTLLFSLATATQAAAVKRTKALNATVTIDGEIDAAWNDAEWITDFQYKTGTTGGKVGPLVVKAKVLWDSEYLYILFDITDPVIKGDTATAWQRDSVEFYIDGDNSKATAFDKKDDFHYNVPAQEGKDKVFIDNASSVQDKTNMKSFLKMTNGGYLVEIACSWKSVDAKVGTVIGFDLQCNDDQDANGTRDVCMGWSDTIDKASSNPSVWGELELVAGKAAPTTEKKEDTTTAAGATTGQAAPVAAAVALVLAAGAVIALRKRAK